MSYEAGRREAQEREAVAVEAAAIEAELAQVCGTLNMAAARQVELIARALENGSYAGSGVRSPEQWVAWQCGVSLRHARELVVMARRLPELPVTQATFAAGELAEDQVAVICRHVPAHNDGEAATWPAPPPSPSCGAPWAAIRSSILLGLPPAPTPSPTLTRRNDGGCRSDSATTAPGA